MKKRKVLFIKISYIFIFYLLKIEFLKKNHIKINININIHFFILYKIRKKWKKIFFSLYRKTKYKFYESIQKLIRTNTN